MDHLDGTCVAPLHASMAKLTPTRLWTLWAIRMVSSSRCSCTTPLRPSAAMAASPLTFRRAQLQLASHRLPAAHRRPRADHLVARSRVAGGAFIVTGRLACRSARRSRARYANHRSVNLLWPV